MNTFFKKARLGGQKGFVSLLLILAVAVASAVIGYTAFENQKKVDVVTPVKVENKLGANGTEIPTSIALFETSLSSAITTSATSMTLVSATDKAGTTFASSTYAFILDEGTASEEMVLADCTNTACTNMIRGLSPLTGTTTVSTLRFAHRRGASVKITDGPQLLILSRMANGQNDYPNLIRYKSGVSITSGDSDQTLASKGYVLNTANAGAATSTESRGGIVELGTLAEQASSYDGGSDKPTVLQTKNSTSTCQVVGSYNIVASSTTGRLDKNCFDQTANYTFTGTNTFSGATTTVTGVTITGTGHGIVFPDSTIQTTGATGVNYQSFLSSGTWTKPTGVSVNSLVVVRAWGAGGGGGGSGSTGAYNGGGGGGGAYVEKTFLASQFGATETITVGTGGSGGVSAGNGTAGGNTTVGSLLTAYGGGFGVGGGTNYGGGGGGGQKSVGGNASGATPGNGGTPIGGGSSVNTSIFGGGYGTTAGESVYGGGGGAVDGNGGASMYGGGGGGVRLGVGGTSLFGGAGGTGGNDTNGGAGVQPAGGGGGAYTSDTSPSNGGAGAAGKVEIWVIN